MVASKTRWSAVPAGFSALLLMLGACSEATEDAAEATAESAAADTEANMEAAGEAMDLEASPGDEDGEMEMEPLKD